ncbi:MAG: putative zinc-binding protein [Promethearchaeota archaeon]
MKKQKKVYIIPCSGIGKVFGSIGREAAYIVTEELTGGKAEIECLPLIVKGKEEVINKIRDNFVIAIDGCPLKCAFHDIEKAIGKVDAKFMTTDIVKENRGLKPEQKIIPIGENTKELSEKLAEKIAKKVEELLENDEVNN